MKSPGRHRPLRRDRSNPPEGVDLANVATRATYVGSPEHKSQRSFAGHPRPRVDASICDSDLDWQQDLVTLWLREALLAGDVGAPWESGYPRYVWKRVDDDVYEGRLLNSGNGEYKGYPLRPEEHPSWI